jgi:hypothetical protein
MNAPTVGCRSGGVDGGALVCLLSHTGDCVCLEEGVLQRCGSIACAAEAPKGAHMHACMHETVCFVRACCTRMHEHAHAHAHSCMHAHAYARVHMYLLHACMHMCTCIYSMHACTCAHVSTPCMHARVHMYLLHACMHAHVHMYLLHASTHLAGERTADGARDVGAHIHGQEAHELRRAE